MLLRNSKAATPYISAQPENGSLSTGVTTVTDATASGGAATKFSTNADLPTGAVTQLCKNPIAPPAKYDHVIWILEENHNYSQVIGNANAPYMTHLATACGSSNRFYDMEPYQEMNPNATKIVAHSRTYYNALPRGSSCKYGNGNHGTACWYSLSEAAKTSLPYRTIYDQVEDAGGTWRTYEESAGTNCNKSDNYPYESGHNPVINFSHQDAKCPTQDVAIPGLSCPAGAATCSGTPTGRLANDIKNGQLPTFAVVVPNKYHDMHDGTVDSGDNWFKAYMQLLSESNGYKRGRTAVFVMWDESFTFDNLLPFVLVAPSANRGIVNTPMTSFSVLRATEQMLGINEYLGCASGVPPSEPGLPPPIGSSCFQGPTADLRTIFNM